MSPASPRRTWFRFSLRTLLILSFLFGSLLLLWQKRQPWRLDAILETTEAVGKGRSYSVGGRKLVERNGKHFEYFINDKPVFAFDFFETRDEATYDSDGPHTYLSSPIMKVMSPDLTKLCVADEFHMCLYDLKEKRLLHEWRLAESMKTIPEGFPNTSYNYFRKLPISFSRDGSLLSTNSFGDIVIMNVQSGEIVSCIDVGFHDRLEFAPNNSLICMEYRSGLELRELSGKLILEKKSDISLNFFRQCVQFLDLENLGKTRHAISWSRGSNIELLNIDDGNLLKTITLPPGQHFEGYSKDKHRMFISKGSNEGSAPLYLVQDSISGEPNWNSESSDNLRSRVPIHIAIPLYRPLATCVSFQIQQEILGSGAFHHNNSSRKCALE